MWIVHRFPLNFLSSAFSPSSQHECTLQARALMITYFLQKSVQVQVSHDDNITWADFMDIKRAQSVSLMLTWNFHWRANMHLQWGDRFKLPYLSWSWNLLACIVKSKQRNKRSADSLLWSTASEQCFCGHFLYPSEADCTGASTQTAFSKLKAVQSDLQHTSSVRH